MSDPITINIDALTEDEAFRVFSEMRNKFGWAGTIFTRGDVEGMLEEYDPIREFTDEQWEDFSSSKNWHRYFYEYLTEKGWEVIQDLLNDWLRAERSAHG